MREIFDYIDNVDPWAMLAAAFALLYVLELAMSALRKRAHRYECAAERIAGYTHGYQDAVARKVPAVRAYTVPDSSVPAAFTRENYRS